MRRAHSVRAGTEAAARLRTIMFVDDHPLIRDALRVTLTALPGWRLVAEACTAREALPLVSVHAPDVVLMDIALPGMDGVIATRELLRRSPASRVLVLTSCRNLRDVREALDAGACGYMLKSDCESLQAALNAVAGGERYISPEIGSRLEPQREDTRADVLGALSQREREVFRLAAQCLTAGRMAQELCIARKTVDTHIYRIHRKLKVRSSAELVRLAMRL